MCKSKFKYQINHYLSLRPQEETVDLMTARLRLEYGVAPAIFQIDRNARPEDQHIIPYIRLEIYADLLQISVENLWVKDEEAESSY